MKNLFKKAIEGWKRIRGDLAGKNGTNDLIASWLLLIIIHAVMFALLVGGVFIIPGIIAASVYCGISCLGGIIAYVEKN